MLGLHLKWGEIWIQCFSCKKKLLDSAKRITTWKRAQGHWGAPACAHVQLCQSNFLKCCAGLLILLALFVHLTCTVATFSSAVIFLLQQSSFSAVILALLPPLFITSCTTPWKRPRTTSWSTTGNTTRWHRGGRRDLVGFAVDGCSDEGQKVHQGVLSNRAQRLARRSGCHHGNLNVAALPPSVRPRDSLGEPVKLQIVVEEGAEECHVLKFFHSNLDIPIGLARVWCHNDVLLIDYRMAPNSHLVKVGFMKLLSSIPGRQWLTQGIRAKPGRASGMPKLTAEGKWEPTEDQHREGMAFINLNASLSNANNQQYLWVLLNVCASDSRLHGWPEHVVLMACANRTTGNSQAEPRVVLPSPARWSQPWVFAKDHYPFDDFAWFDDSGQSWYWEDTGRTGSHIVGTTLFAHRPCACGRRPYGKSTRKNARRKRTCNLLLLVLSLSFVFFFFFFLLSLSSSIIIIIYFYYY